MSEEQKCCESCESRHGCLGDPRDFGESPCLCHSKETLMQGFARVTDEAIEENILPDKNSWEERFEKWFSRAKKSIRGRSGSYSVFATKKDAKEMSGVARSWEIKKCKIIIE